MPVMCSDGVDEAGVAGWEDRGIVNEIGENGGDAAR